MAASRSRPAVGRVRVQRPERAEDRQAEVAARAHDVAHRQLAEVAGAREVPPACALGLHPQVREPGDLGQRVQLHQLLAHRRVGDRAVRPGQFDEQLLGPGDHRAGAPAAGSASPHEVAGPLAEVTDDRAGEGQGGLALAAGAEALALERQRRVGDGPAVVGAADDPRRRARGRRTGRPR